MGCSIIGNLRPTWYHPRQQYTLVSQDFEDPMVDPLSQDVHGMTSCASNYPIILYTMFLGLGNEGVAVMYLGTSGVDFWP